MQFWRLAAGFVAVSFLPGGIALAQVTGAYVEACAADPSWSNEQEMFTGSAVTPKMFCECLAERYREKKLSQSDVDFLTKLRRNALTDEEMQNYATAEDLLAADVDLNGNCRIKLGLKSVRPDDAPEEGVDLEGGFEADDPVGDEPTDDEPGSGPD